MSIDAKLAQRTLISLVALFFSIAIFHPGNAQGKDLQTRWGVGAYVQPGLVPALGVRYGFPAKDKALNIQLEVIAGMKASTFMGSEQAFGGLRLQNALIAEDHLNFFAAISGFYLYEAQSGETPLTGFDARLTAGSEFFPFGMQNLGLLVEAGVQTTGLSQGDAERTISVQSTAAIGFHYYF